MATFRVEPERLFDCGRQLQDVNNTLLKLTGELAMIDFVSITTVATWSLVGRLTQITKNVGSLTAKSSTLVKTLTHVGEEYQRTETTLVNGSTQEAVGTAVAQGGTVSSKIDGLSTHDDWGNDQFAGIMATGTAAVFLSAQQNATATRGNANGTVAFLGKTAVEQNQSGASVKSIGLTGNVKGDIESFYHDRFAGEERATNKQEYVHRTVGSESDKKKLIGDLYYQKLTDVQDGYAKLYSGDGYDQASAGVSKTNVEYVITEGASSELDIKLNTLDMHGVAELNPKEGSVFASGGFAYDLAAAELSTGNIDTDGYSLGVGVKAGVGGSFDVGIHNGIFKCDVGASLGIGANIKIEFDYKQAWNDMCDMFNPGNWFR